MAFLKTRDSKSHFVKINIYKALPFPFLSLSAVLTSPLLVSSSILNFSPVSSTRISIYQTTIGTLISRGSTCSQVEIADVHSAFLVAHRERVKWYSDTRLLQDVSLRLVPKYASFLLVSTQQGSPVPSKRSMAVCSAAVQERERNLRLVEQLSIPVELHLLAFRAQQRTSPLLSRSTVNLNLMIVEIGQTHQMVVS